jgi:lambda repressor-like predicted transcriptional regulator
MGASVRTDTVDWPRVIHEIRGAGLMLCAIARRVGVAPTTLGNLASGATREPCYSVGARLLELREKVSP